MHTAIIDSMPSWMSSPCSVAMVAEEGIAIGFSVPAIAAVVLTEVTVGSVVTVVAAGSVVGLTAAGRKKNEMTIDLDVNKQTNKQKNSIN